MKEKYKILRGFHDILPHEIPYWQEVINRINKLSGIYNFTLIKMPILEETELFYKSTGEYTDIVSKEMYTFTDRSGKSVTLRPEGTPSCIRACIENSLYKNYPLPLKLYYIGEMLRYEKPQSGRFRQHTQYGFEIIGDPGPESDAEIIFFFNGSL